MNLTPRIITGRKVQLEPLTGEFFEPLCECLLQEPDGWFSSMFGFNNPQAITTIMKIGRRQIRSEKPSHLSLEI